MRHFTFRLSSFILTVFFMGCLGKVKEQTITKEDNILINEMYRKDMEVRELDAKTGTVNLEEYDKKHREKVFQLLAENKVITPKDKIRAAWILQHTAARICDGALTSVSPENFLLAYKLSVEALGELEQANDTITIRKENVRRITALNYDRYLFFTFGYQKFGTQFVFDDKTGEMLLAPIDTTMTSDEERKKHNVESMDSLLAKYKMKPLVK